MPSTYSTRLRLEEIANGEQASTWGDTTNKNLGDLLEQAIAGVASIVLADANYTLTASNGVVDESRSAALVVTGSLTAIRVITAPSVQKLYVIRNGTTGGFAIQIKTSAGAAYSIPNGDIAVVYTDGIDFYLAGVTASQLATVTASVAGKANSGANSDITSLSAATAITNLTSINGKSNFLVPAGFVCDFSGTSAPAGWLALPLVATNISRVTYADLFAAIGTTWGAGDGSTTFGMPYCPANYAALAANGNVGTTTTGEVKSHTHANGFNAQITASGGGVFYAGALTANTDSTGGAANLAAGVYFLKCVKI